MKRTLVLVLLLTSCGKPTQKQSSPESLKLSDSYARAAVLGLLAIESDVLTTEDQNGQKVVTGTTQSKIDAADAEARTEQEVSMTKLLRQIYEEKLAANEMRIAQQHLTDARIKNYPIELEYHRSHPDTKLFTKDDILKDVARFEQRNAETSKREAACFEPLKQALRDRVSITPEPCLQLISSGDAKPVNQPMQ